MMVLSISGAFLNAGLFIHLMNPATSVPWHFHMMDQCWHAGVQMGRSGWLSRSPAPVPAFLPS